MSRPSELSNAYYQQLLRILGMAASLMPFLVIGLGFLVKFGVLDHRYYAGDGVFVLVAAGFICGSLVNYYFVFIRKNPTFQAYLLLSILYHVLGVVFLLFIGGVYSPFLFGWVIMSVAVDAYFGLTSTLLSMAVLCLVCLASFLLHPGIPPQEQLAMFATVVLIITVCITLSMIRDVNDRERADLAQTRDRANFQRERLLALVNSMGDAVITTDEHGLITVYNAATLSLLDTNIDLVGKNIDEVLRLTDTRGERAFIVAEARKQNRVFSRNDVVHMFNGDESMNIYLNVAPVQPGYHANGERGFIFILRDITKEKSLEEERDEFISVVSHELRTPIAIAEGTVSNLMLMQERNAAKQMTADAAKSAHDQILYLAKLVNDLSTLSRAERGLGGEIEVIDLANTLQDLYKEYAPQVEAKGLRLDLNLLPKLPHMRTSKLYLQEVLQNLMTNSLKYTDEGGVTLATALEDGDLRISIKDTGIGISKYDQRRIFQKFYRSEDYRTRETGGTGLGLYVCRKLAEKLHIKIDFESRLNHGSQFSLIIPKNQLTDEPVQAHVEPPVGFVPTK